MSKPPARQKTGLLHDIKLWLIANRIPLLILTGLVLIAYANSVDNGFASDDMRAIVSKRNLGTFQYLIEDFPVVFRRIFINIIYLLVGKQPWAYRLFNIIFHLGSTFALYTLVKKLHGKAAAITASTLLAVHPVMVEAVTWICGGPYSFYTFFILMTLYFFVVSDKKKLYHYAFLACFFLSFTASKKALSLPPLLVSMVAFYPQARKNWKKLILPFSIGIVFGIFYISQISKRIHFLQTHYFRAVSGSDPLRQFPASIGKYLELLVWPDKLTLYHSEIYHVFGPSYYLRLFETLVYLGAIVYTFFSGRKKVTHWLLFLLIGLAPMMTPIGISWWVAERYVYLGSIGIFVIIGMLVSRLIKSEDIAEEAVWVLFAILILTPLTIRTIVRNQDWQNEDALWISAKRTSPNSPQNNNNLGDYYARRGQWDQAIYHFQKAINNKPGYAAAHHNLGLVYTQIADQELARAAQLEKKKEEANPEETAAIEQEINQAAQHIQEAKRRALAHFQASVDIDETIWQSQHYLAIAHLQLGNHEKAIEHIDKAIAENPEMGELKQVKQQMLKIIEQGGVNNFQQTQQTQLEKPTEEVPDDSDLQGTGAPEHTQPTQAPVGTTAAAQ